MKKIAAALALGLALGSAGAAEMSEEQKTFYALGQVLARNVSVFSLTRAELDAVQKGFRDGVLGSKSAVDMNVYGPKIQPLAATRQAAASEKSAAAGKAQLAKAAEEKGAVKAQSGLVYLSLREGKGSKPAPTDVVSVHYRGTLIDGTEFDSSYSRNQPATFGVAQVIPGWTEALQLMKEGDKWEIYIPAKLAYGERVAGGRIPPNSTLVFEVQLLEVKGK